MSSSLDEYNDTTIFVAITFHVPESMSYADRCIVVNFIETRFNLAFLSNQSPRNAMAVRSVIDILQENESCKADISRLVKENKRLKDAKINANQTQKRLSEQLISTASALDESNARRESTSKRIKTIEDVWICVGRLLCHWKEQIGTVYKVPKISVGALVGVSWQLIDASISIGKDGRFNGKDGKFGYKLMWRQVQKHDIFIDWICIQ